MVTGAPSPREVGRRHFDGLAKREFGDPSTVGPAVAATVDSTVADPVDSTVVAIGSFSSPAAVPTRVTARSSTAVARIACQAARAPIAAMATAATRTVTDRS